MTESCSKFCPGAGGENEAQIPKCALCRSANVRKFCRDRNREFYQCDECSLVFVPPWQFLSPEEERTRYDLHQNSPDDPNYRRHLNRLFIPLHQSLIPGSSGLDFGSGPEPVLSLLFTEAGYSMTLFDCYYKPDLSALQREYDFIAASEVVEHLHDPGKELDRLWASLKPGGKLGIMTRPVVERSGFSEWQYKNDRTHVCFFSPATFDWLARRWGAELFFANSDVVLFQKNLAEPAAKSTVRTNDQ